jgi:hypothetical protein
MIPAMEHRLVRVLAILVGVGPAFGMAYYGALSLFYLIIAFPVGD